MNGRRALGLILAAALASTGLAQAQSGDSLADFTLEDLLDTEVISVSKKSQRLVDTPSAAYVITAADIRRSGSTTIPDLLRRVPGLEVQQSTSNSWAVTGRGFNLEFSNKLLVLIDGRSVYTPLFSGVYWDIQTPPLEDIDRIEVVRGPGASVWGANAVNGVINIITKHARDTRGNYLRAAAGNVDRVNTSFSIGRDAGDTAQWRVSGQAFNRAEFDSTTGGDSGDGWRQARVGARTDWQPTARDDVRASWSYYYGEHRNVFRTDQVLPGSGLPFPIDPAGFLTPEVENKVRGGDVILSWTHAHSETSSSQGQISYDQRRRENPVFGERRQTWEATYQHHFTWRDRHQIIWGGGARLMTDSIDDSVNIDFGTKTRAKDSIYSGFVQDEIELLEDQLWLTLGSKLEWQTYTGWEIQPTARVMWQPAERHRVWGAVSRPVRTPSRAEREISALTTNVIPAGVGGCPGPGGCALQLFGNDHLDSEKLLAYELGYRLQPHEDLALDFAGFFNDYENLAGFDPDPLNPFARTTRNREQARSYGLEASGTWRARDWWKLEGSFTSIRVRSDGVIFASPGYRYSLRSQMDLPLGLELDLGLYFTDEFKGTTLSGVPLEFDRHWRGNARLGWRPTPDLLIELVGQNLIDPDEAEWAPNLSGAGQAEIPASFYARVTWTFE